MPFSYYDDMDRDDQQERALRYNSGKPMWSLVDFDALIPMVEVLMYGAQKYAPDNWKKGLPINEILDSMQRHMNAFRAGENEDEESKKKHVGHILCNAMFLSYMHLYKPDFDDRIKDKNKEEHKLPI